MIRFEPLELAHQLVELGIRDLGVGENVIPLFVMTNEAAKLLDAVGW